MMRRIDKHEREKYVRRGTYGKFIGNNRGEERFIEVGVIGMW
jgi:hypothetical protein